MRLETTLTLLRRGVNFGEPPNYQLVVIVSWSAVMVLRPWLKAIDKGILTFIHSELVMLHTNMCN